MQVRVDMHAHFYGGGLVEMLSARRTRPCLHQLPDGSRNMVAMNGEFPFKPAYFDLSTGLAQMESQGFTHRMLTFPGALCVDVLPGPEVAKAIGAFNTHLASLHAATGGRIFGLAGLPLADMPAAVTELRRIRRELRLPGIILPGNYFTSIEQARSWRHSLRQQTRPAATSCCTPA